MSTVCAQRYQDKVMIITGGSMGIGKACVQLFVRNGSKVVFCDIEVAGGKELETEVNGAGPGKAVFIQCDVRKEDEIKNVIERTVEDFGRIDCLANIAGRHPPHMPIDNFSSDDFRELLNMNLISYFCFAKYALPYLRQTKGNIINCASLVAQIGQSAAVTYAASKGGIVSMTKALAIDEAKHGVRVNSISPGNIWTESWALGVQDVADPKGAIEAGKDCQLMGKFGTTEEAAQAFLYLAAEASFCTGIDLVLSGGAELNYGNKNQCKEKASPYA
ncbi:hypothetical protein ScPMuIL_016706 [Solemya velum]